ncbi:PREDICTED: MOB kinase activator 3B isoform X1 [Dipodomys ordii]|uniref:MOB kinase activator 3B isoform X1 n=1 Tax=Dipodomys ordii TaxID=10020 RepID=A0A1S3FJR9_DIPOR|nr:PREDICTED: MOB kinase activator 3B isoform X1 [Dipodomys ordii]XP_012876273.1 PREDICTED: MOB kinase activator 3B isoform X1 [Dipodomys ordii]XP_012876274.1 PREDICTED: MOB kinase activator 3B isoform X1 [Dipodomys ordii]XP_012876275.1 PREDICTED: MOB kinase activator 3B isoform X1 [Dipodomys ordii]
MPITTLLLRLVLFSSPFLPLSREQRTISLLWSLGLERSLNLTFSSFKSQNSSYADGCWLCLSHSSSALPVPLNISLTQHIRLAYSEVKGSPFFVQSNTHLQSYPSSREVQVTSLYSTYLNSLHYFKLNSTPIFGPIICNTSLLAPAALCFSSPPTPFSTLVGILPPYLCNHTISVEHPSDHQNTRVDYAVSPEANGKFLQPVRFTGPPKINAPGLRCSWPLDRSYRLFPWLTNSVLRYQCLQSAFHSNSLTLLPGIALASSLSVWSAEPAGQGVYPLLHLFSFHMSSCLPGDGSFFLCGSTSYLCLPTNWTGTCTLVYLLPPVF